MASLRIPDDSAWEEWPISEESVIYVRACYPVLYDLCEKAWETQQLVVIKGSPGVGKSLFINYALFHLLSKNQKVLVVSGPDDKALLYSDAISKPETCPLQQARQENWAAKADYVLFDPHEDPRATQAFSGKFFCRKKALVAISPDPENLTKILKDIKAKQTFYMGPADFEEAEVMRSCCYADIVTQAQLRERFAVAGGIPRVIFQAASKLVGQDSVIDNISERQTFALNDLADNARRIDSGSVASEYKSLWSLYHLVPTDETHSRYTIEICCDNALSLLRRRLLEKSVQELWQLFDTTDERQGTLRGIRFEAYAHKKILVDGLSIAARKLNAKNISPTTTINVVIPKGSRMFSLANNDVSQLVNQKATVARAGGGYMLPILPNYPVIDSVYVTATSSATMLQMKAGKSKPLSSNFVHIVHAALGNVFVVVTPEKNIVTRKLAGGPTRMDQYVVILNETEEL